MDVAEKRAQERQAPLRVLLRAIPVDQGRGGKSVAQVVQARPVAVAYSAQADAPRSRVEGPMNRANVQSIAPARDEQVRGDRACGPMPLALLEVLRRHLAGGSMQRKPSIFAKLTAADGQHPRLQIEVIELEITRFTDPKTRHAEQSKQTVVDPRKERADLTLLGRERHVKCAVQELLNLPIGIKVRPGPLGLEGQESQCRNLRARIPCTSITCELADVTEAARPVRRLRVLRPLRPAERQRLGNIRSTATFHECGEVRQRSTGVVQLKAETSAQRQVFCNRLPQRVHRTPPGQG